MPQVSAPPEFRGRLLEALPRLTRYARSLTFDEAEAEDVCQIALERALLHWRQFDPTREMVVWLLSIAHNAFLDGRRRSARLQVTDPHELQQAQDDAGGTAGTDVGLRLDLLAALGRLSPEQREPLLLVCVEQLSYAEVADVMHIPIGTVMSRVCRARQALRRHLEAPARVAGTPLRRVV